MSIDELLTIKDVARLCRVHEMTIRRHINDGRLKAVRVGRNIRIRRDELDAYLEPEISAPIGRPLDPDDPILKLAGFIHAPQAADLSENKYAAFADLLVDAE